MRKIYKVISISIVVCVVLIVLYKYIFVGILSNYLPWTRTNFSSYENYVELLMDHHFYAAARFAIEVPSSSKEEKYFVHQNYRKKIATHSFVLSDKQYIEMIEVRMNPYLQYSNESWVEMVYILEENKKCRIEEMEIFELEGGFLNNVMQNPNFKEEYYPLIIIKFKTTYGTCYTGVIANDINYELIEFSVEIPDEA